MEKVLARSLNAAKSKPQAGRAPTREQQVPALNLGIGKLSSTARAPPQQKGLPLRVSLKKPFGWQIEEMKVAETLNDWMLALELVSGFTSNSTSAAEVDLLVRACTVAAKNEEEEAVHWILKHPSIKESAAVTDSHIHQLLRLGLTAGCHRPAIELAVAIQERASLSKESALMTLTLCERVGDWCTSLQLITEPPQPGKEAQLRYRGAEVLALVLSMLEKSAKSDEIKAITKLMSKEEKHQIAKAYSALIAAWSPR